MKAFASLKSSVALLIMSILAGFIWPQSLHADNRLNNPEDIYYFGVYLYSSFFEAAAIEQKRDYFDLLDEHLTILAAHGVNCAHLTIIKPQRIEKYLQLAQKHGIKLLPQLDFAYFNPDWTQSQMQEHADKAVDFLKKWKDAPQVLAWSVKEEPYPKDIEKLEKYYDLILKEIPDLNLFITCHWASPLSAISAKYPFKFVGGDYYYFSWDQGTADKTHLRTPREALDLTRNITAVFYNAGKKHTTNYFHVFPCASGLEQPRAEGFASGKTLPADWTETQKQQYIQKIETLAASQQDGWTRFPNGESYEYNLWKMYLPPANCLKALAWSGIFNGAKSSLCFFYSPYSKKYAPDSPEDAVRNYRREIFYTTLAGRPGQPNPHLKEFAETSREIRSYGKIIKRWKLLVRSPVNTDEKRYVFNQAFEVEGIPGTAVLIHNSNVGELRCEACPKNDIPCNHVFIDQQGNLKNFHPYTKQEQARFSFTEISALKKNVRVFRVDTGLELTHVNGCYTIDIDPGSAKILFIGTPENAIKIHKLYDPYGSI